MRHCGPTNQLYYLINNLDKNKFIPVILTLSKEPENSKINDFKQLDVPIYTLSLRRFESFIKAKKVLRKIVSEIKPDLIHSQGIRPDIMVNKHLENHLHVATLRNFPYDDYPMKFGKIMGQLMAKSHIKALKKIKNLVTVSNANANRVKKLGVEIKTIQNGVDNKKYTPTEKKDRKTLLKKYALPDDKGIFISVGSLISLKDPETIIKGFLGYSKNNKFCLVFLGEGPLFNTLIEKYEGHENIMFKGNQSNVVDFLKASDYFISASLSEGMPNTVLEALSCGIPVCLSSIEPHEEILSFNNQAGVTFRTSNINDLTEKIEKLINDVSYESRRKAGLTLIKENLSAEIMTKKYMSLYEEILQND